MADKVGSSLLIYVSLARKSQLCQPYFYMMRWAVIPNILRSHERDIVHYPKNEKPLEILYLATLMACKVPKWEKSARKCQPCQPYFYMMRWAVRPNILRSHDRDMVLHPKNEKPLGILYLATLLAHKVPKSLKSPHSGGLYIRFY